MSRGCGERRGAKGEREERGVQSCSFSLPRCPYLVLILARVGSNGLFGVGLVVPPSVREDIVGAFIAPHLGGGRPSVGRGGRGGMGGIFGGGGLRRSGAGKEMGDGVKLEWHSIGAHTKHTLGQGARESTPQLTRKSPMLGMGSVHHCFHPSTLRFMINTTSSCTSASTGPEPAPSAPGTLSLRLLPPAWPAE